MKTPLNLKQFQGCEAEVTPREHIVVDGPMEKSDEVKAYLLKQGFYLTRTGPWGDGTDRFRHAGHRDTGDTEVV